MEDLQVKGEGKVKKAMKESFRVLNEVSLVNIYVNYHNYILLNKMIILFEDSCSVVVKELSY